MGIFKLELNKDRKMEIFKQEINKNRKEGQKF